ncbi:serine hydrolase [Phormidium tenue FACHB-886]|nr:serine hydrolase [Phormidium tenue FACHB-886]
MAQLPPASPVSPSAALDRLFTTPRVESEWFTDSFLQQVPVAQLEQIIAGLRQSLGEYQQIQPNGSSYSAVFAGGKVSTQIALDAEGRIAGLFFSPPELNAISAAEAITQLKALPGQTSLLILKNGQELAAYNADQPLAVGSSFKLAVLLALRQQIDQGKRSWADVVELRPQDRSLFGGILDTWYDGALLTLQSLATLMISQSDNTATDVLINQVGREAIEFLAPHNQPLLTTRELLILKAPQSSALLQRYQSADTAQRRQILAELAQLPLPNRADFGTATQPVAIDSAEWFFTSRELCTLMQQVEDLPLMSVTPGINPTGWSRIAYKGGSEAGVLNLTHWLQAPDGTTYCVSTTWNNSMAPLDETQFSLLYSALIAGLKPAPSQ